MKFINRKRKKPNVHLTSLIDIVFLLLVFFLLSSNFVDKQGIPIIVPQVDSENPDLIPEVTIDINEKGVIYLEGLPLDQSILLDVLKQELENSPNLTVAIRADRRVEYDKVVNVIDAAKLAGAKTFFLVTQEKAR